MISLFNHPLYRSELETVVKACQWREELGGKTIAVTGASGLIGSAIVDILLYCNETLQNPVHIFALGRNIEKLQTRFGTEQPELQFVLYNANEKNVFPETVDYVIHAAGNAQPDKYVSHPAETMTANFSGMRDWLEFARRKKAGRVLYVSSSEVYGKLDTGLPILETDYGFVDIMDTRSSYAVSKRAAEALCKAYCSEYGTDVVMVRPGHIYGPTAGKTDTRIFAVLVHMAGQGSELVLKSAGTQKRSYCHCLDCAAAILTVLLRGQAGEPYNISNRNSIITIREMAEIIAKKAGIPLRFDLPTQRERQAFNPMDNSSLNAEHLEALGWYGCISAQEGFEEYIEIQKTLCKEEA